MSRTVRRKNTWNERWNGKKWSVSYHGYDENGIYRRIPYDLQSEEYKKNSAIYHSDAGTHPCKEPGPGWWRRQFYQRPYRRDAKNQIRKYFLDSNFEIIIDEMPDLDWWT